MVGVYRFRPRIVLRARPIAFMSKAVAQWKKLAFTSEPPTPNAWNQLKLEAGTGWKKLLLEGE